MSNGGKCKGGCGFHGNPNTNDMCSKCFRDYMQSIGVDMPPTSMKPSAEGKASVVKSEESLLGGKVKVSVRLGDLTVDKVDIIVNAANRTLSHASGLAGAIVKRGGEIIQDESDIYIAEKGRLEDGGVMYTGAGKLPAKHIIHCVGPMWRTQQQPECEALLALAIKNTLQMATVELKASSIVIPAISSGIFGFPKQKCGQIIYDTVIDFIFANRDNPKQTLKDIRLTNFDDQTVEVFMRVQQSKIKENIETEKKLAAAKANASAGDKKNPPPSSAAVDNKKENPPPSSGSGGSGSGSGGGGGDSKSAAAPQQPAGGAADNKSGASAAASAGGGGASAAKKKLLLLGDDLTAGFYGVYQHPLYGPRDAKSPAKSANSDEPIYSGAGANVKYHQYAIALNDKLKSSDIEVVARAYVGATVDIAATKIKSLLAASTGGEFLTAVVLIGSNDVIGVDATTPADAETVIVDHLVSLHAWLNTSVGIKRTIAVTLPPIDIPNVKELTSANDRTRAVAMRDTINAALAKAAAASKDQSIVLFDAAKGMVQNEQNKALWDDAWHFSPAGSDAFAAQLHTFLAAQKFL